MSNETDTERPYRERTPWLDRFVSRQVGKALVWLARRAHARGDRHEFNCPSCDKPVQVTWREVTARTDRERWWRPTTVSCPNDCDAARRMA